MSVSNLDEDKAIRQLRDHIIEREDGTLDVKVDVGGKVNTVEIRGIYPFEQDIVDSLVEPSADGSISGAAVPIKGKWIHGWLEAKGEDYINSVWRNYQFFTKYLEAYTSNIQNVRTHDRAPGTYDSTYRFIIMLEQAGVLERFERRVVPQENYDHFVPDEFRARTFIQNTRAYEEAKDVWDNPIEAVYGEIEPEEEPEEETFERIEPEEPEDDREEPEEQVAEGEFSEFGLPEQNASINQFNQQDELLSFIRASIPDALEAAFENNPFEVDVAPTDFGLRQVGIVGKWVEGDATPGETELFIAVGIDGTDADATPAFIPPQISTQLPIVLNRNNQFSSIFSQYDAIAGYSSAYSDVVSRFVNNEQDLQAFYDLIGQEFKEV